MEIDIHELMRWAQNAAPPGNSGNWTDGAPAYRRAVRLEISAEPEVSGLCQCGDPKVRFGIPHDLGNNHKYAELIIVVARAYLLAPRCDHRVGSLWSRNLMAICECGPLAERRLS